MRVDEESGKEEGDVEYSPSTFKQLSVQVSHAPYIYYFVSYNTYTTLHHCGEGLRLFRSGLHSS